ncbi:MAG: mechanosensitive ion channel family protein [Gammaproteobacteria bacterium]|nr:MAG: mechanosensitive ion channel family protein [Gammaproteobacteria bacterium]
MKPFRWLVLLFCLMAGGFVSTAVAATSTTTAAKEAAEEKPVVPPGLASPRDTLATFLGAMNDIKRGDPKRLDDALATLDLSDINPLVRRERGETLAWQLLEVMDRTRVVDLKKVPLRPRGNEWIFARYDKGVIRLRRQEDGRWLFDAATLRQLPAIYEHLSRAEPVKGLEDNSEYLPWEIRLQRMMPAPLRHKTFLLENWRWLALLVTVVLGVLADWIVSFLLRHLMRRWLRRSRGDFSAVADSENRLRPLGLVAMAAVWWAGINAVGLPELALVILSVAVKALASLAAVWAAYRLVDIIAAWLRARAAATDNKIDDVLVPLVSRSLKIFVTVVGLVFIADNLNIDITGLLAGLGLGGLAFALAAKDMVQNLFGSVTVLLDRTFTVGDWIVLDDIEGTVEEMGFRSTRIRTFYNSLVTVPNSRFITAKVDNMGKRRYRRYKAHFGIAYDTPPERIEAFCEALRELVREHPYMRKDYFHIYLNDLGDSALSVLVYVFWETPDWATELRERHRFLLDCLRVAHELEVEYAFPTQTVYLRNEEHQPPPAGDPPLSEAAERGRETARRVVAASGTTAAG